LYKEDLRFVLEENRIFTQAGEDKGAIERDI